MASHYILNNDYIDIKSKEHLNYYVSDEEIMYHYFGPFVPNNHYKCPFKPEKQPSFYISYYKGELRWTRWGMFDNRSHNVVNFVQKLYDIHYYRALNKIHTEIVLENKRIDKKIIKDIKESSDYKKPDQKFRYIPFWGEETLKYWKSFKITEDTLIDFDVYVCLEYWIGMKMFHEYEKDDPLYVYIHDMDEEIFTCYRPLGNKDKEGRDQRFRKNNISNHVMGLDHCHGGNIAFITSSYKDIMAFHEIGFDSIAPHSESGWNYQAFLNAIVYLKEKYNYVYVAFDNDSTGVHQSIKMTKQFGLNYWNVPKMAEGVDPSDVLKNYDKDYLIKSIHSKFKRDKISF